MADGERQSVGPVGGLGQLVQAEQELHHLLHLLLVGGAVTRDRLLDLVGAVLNHLHAGFGGGGHGETARLSDAHSGASVDLEQHPLDDHHIRLCLLQDGPELAEQRAESLGQGVGRRRRQVTSAHLSKPTALLGDGAVAAA